MSEAYRLRHSNNDESYGTSQTENFCIFNVLCVFISLITILADLTTDVLVFAEYCKDGYLYWGLATLIFIVTPNILINIFSIRWFIIDQKTGRKDCILHLLLAGLLQRYSIFLQNVFTCQGFEAVQSQKLISQRNDLSLLHFLYIFTGTIPQIILQTYSVLVLDGNSSTKVLALAASNVSVFWGCATYIYSIMTFTGVKFQWISFVLRLFWYFSMLVARVWSVLLFTIIFGVWVLLPLGVHWTAMTFWIVVQNTTFCPNKLEETLYNVVMGFVYCFCYINLREGHTRYRLMMFYTFMVTQNFGSLLLYVLISDTSYHEKPWSIIATVCIIGGTISGVSAMILYYRYFHTKSPITWKTGNEDVELNNKISSPNNGLKSVRSFKCIEKEKNGDQRNNPVVMMKTDLQNVSNDVKSLDENCIKKSGQLAAASSEWSNMDSTRVKYYNSKKDLLNKKFLTKKQVTVCSPTELTLKMSSIENMESSIDEITTISLNIQKRRGIYSTHEFYDELNNMNLESSEKIHELINTKEYNGSVTSHGTEGSNSNKKNSSDSIDMDLDLSLSDINSSDINTYNENIVQKLCLSALKNIKVGNQDADIENIQKIAVDILKEMYDQKGKQQCVSDSNSVLSKQRDLDTPTEHLSVHDYENICAVNIAREAWGLRSWNGYTDIENWLHDGSVVRDRRRDTLTSASTEVSSCISHELKNAIMGVQSLSKRAPTYSNVYVKCERNFDDYVNTSNCNSNDDTFLAKPCMVENKDFNQLEPIIEELDDLGDIDPSLKKKMNPKSSLVATIDEIRKTTKTNSPKNIQPRCHLLNFPRSSANLDSNLKKALWKEPSKFITSNTMKSLPKKDNVLTVQNPKLVSNQKTNVSTMSPSEQSTSNTKSSKRRHKKNCYVKSQPTNFHEKNYHNEHEFSSNNIDLLWQLVTDNSIQSMENLRKSNKVSTSLQSLIQNDTSSTKTSKASNVKKSLKSKPRRKFSILRERFEPKPTFYPDEDEIYQSCKGTVNTGFVDKTHTK